MKEDIRKHNLDTIRKTIETSKSLNKVRRTHILSQNRLITLLDNQGREIQDQDKILERIKEFYAEIYDSDQTVTIRTDSREVPSVTTWEVEAALKKMKNGKATGNDQVEHRNVEGRRGYHRQSFRLVVYKMYIRKTNPHYLEKCKDGDNLQKRQKKNT